MNDGIREKLKYLGLHQLEERWDQILVEGVEMSAPRFLDHLVNVLYDARIQRACTNRLKSAKIPEPWVMATYPFDQQPKLSKRKILSIHDSLDYMTKKQNLILIGPTGVGKTGIGASFLEQAISNGYSGLFITFSELIGELYRSVAAHKEDKTLKKYARYACLQIDEIGYVDVEPAQTGLFFRLMSMRHRTKTTIISSNLGFQEWGAFLKNQQLTAALLDRLTENSHVINMRGCISIRPKGVDSEGASDSGESKTSIPQTDPRNRGAKRAVALEASAPNGSPGAQEVQQS
jgi:DNA replication protein DnaC